MTASIIAMIGVSLSCVGYAFNPTPQGTAIMVFTCACLAFTLAFHG
jgi:hypothetical protein